MALDCRIERATALYQLPYTLSPTRTYVAVQRTRSAREKEMPRIAQQDIRYPLHSSPAVGSMYYTLQPHALPDADYAAINTTGLQHIVDIRRPYYLALPGDGLLHETYWYFPCIVSARCAALAGQQVELRYRLRLHRQVLRITHAV
jgi:hypothetical protein